jgi:hypothetical protein
VASEATTGRLLHCIECDAISGAGAEGWRAYIVFLEEDGEPAEVVFYCPSCAEFEFG